MFIIVYYVGIGSHPRCRLKMPGMLPFTNRDQADAELAEFKRNYPDMLSYEIHELTKVFEVKTPQEGYLT